MPRRFSPNRLRAISFIPLRIPDDCQMPIEGRVSLPSAYKHGVDLKRATEDSKNQLEIAGGRIEGDRRGPSDGGLPCPPM